MNGSALSSRARARRPPVPAAVGSASRAAGALVVAVLMALGCAVLWAGIPFGWLWLAAAISDTPTAIYLIALVGAPVTMVAGGLGLSRLNRIYLRLRGTQKSKLFHALLVGSVFLAILAFVLWYVLFSPPPSGAPWPSEGSGPGD